MVFGQTTLNGIGPGNGLNQLNNPQGVAIDGTTLWVVDAGNNRVLRFDNASTLPNGPTADGVLGAGGTNSAQVNGPVGIPRSAARSGSPTPTAIACCAGITQPARRTTRSRTARSVSRR